MHARVRVHRAAAAELEAAASWYEEQCVGLGADFVEEIRRVVGLIVESPREWPVSPWDSRARSVRLARFPYSVVFVEAPEDELVIVAVAHGRRKPGYWRARGR